MPSQPKKDQIAEALVTLAEGISRGAGFRNDFKSAKRYRLAVNEINQSRLPVFSVWVANTEEAPETCMGSYRERVEFVFDLWWRAAKKEDVDAVGLSVEADLRSKVLEDPRLGLSFVHHTSPGRVQGDAQHYVDQQLGYKAVGFVVDYNWTASAP